MSFGMGWDGGHIRFYSNGYLGFRPSDGADQDQKPKRGGLMSVKVIGGGHQKSNCGASLLAKADYIQH